MSNSNETGFESQVDSNEAVISSETTDTQATSVRLNVRELLAADPAELDERMGEDHWPRYLSQDIVPRSARFSVDNFTNFYSLKAIIDNAATSPSTKVIITVLNGEEYVIEPTDLELKSQLQERSSDLVQKVLKRATHIEIVQVD